ncbi:hypothetical protein [Caulobacter phage BL198]|uniref:Uncharacterized protein n=1 Tax=Caulobacter phage BL198 TaxID=3020395 RepID=A0AAF0B4P2_9CAUD|nr:hypothetical protein [Caulobacter phage BL198]
MDKKQFYRDMLAWIEAGCPDHQRFRKSSGLCSNSESYGVGVEVQQDLIDKYGARGTAYPFGGYTLYYERAFSRRLGQYESKARVAFIRERAQ